MSEGVPKRKVGDDVQIMNTDDMQKLGIANERGTVTMKVLSEDSYVVKLVGVDNPYIIPAHSLRVWVEPKKEMK